MTPDITPHDFRSLDDKHPRAAFSCGNANLDTYLRESAGQSSRRMLAVVHVCQHADNNDIIGYYTLTSSSIDAGHLPEELVRSKRYRPTDKIGITLLGRFAIDSKYAGRGWGIHMYMHATYNALVVSNTVASCGIILDTETEEARRFWRAREFISLGLRENERERFFISMEYIRKLHSE